MRKIKKYMWLYLFVVALVPLLICSKCSPLYPLNDWYDINIFFTAGKGIVNGKVLYAELFDHKGPYVYWVASLAYLISNTTFWGYFVIEVANLWIFLFFTTKSLRLYDIGIPFWCYPLLTMAICISDSFVHGGSVEELSLGIFSYSLYSLLRLVRSDEVTALPTGNLVINGFLAGVVFWSKFTMMGFYLAWCLLVFGFYLWKKEYRLLAKQLLGFCFGCILATVPVLLYFGVNGALRDLGAVYFYNNIWGYGTGVKTSLFQKVKEVAIALVYFLKRPMNRWYTVPLVLGCVGYLFCSRKLVSFKEKAWMVFMAGGTACGLFFGGALQDYYGLPLAIFLVIPLFIMQSMLWLLNKGKWNLSPIQKSIVSIGLLIVSIVICYTFSPNVYLQSIEKDDMPQYRFAEQIAASDDQTVLNYGFLDCGLYTVLNQTPSVRMFCVTNMDYYGSLEIQEEYVRQGLINWVVTWNELEVPEEELKMKPIVSEYYDLVDFQYYWVEGDYRTFALYQKKNATD